MYRAFHQSFSTNHTEMSQLRIRAVGMEKMKLRPRKGFVFTVVAAVVISVLAACSPGSAPTAPSKDVPLQSGEQTTLPFRGFDYREMGVDAKNVLYLGGTGGFATLPSGADQPAPMRPSGNPVVSTFGVAPDGRLSFVALGGAVETIAPGSTTPEPLPFDKLTKFGQMAVGTDGSVYITDNQRNKLLKLAPGAAAPIELPVEIGNGLGHLVIDADDNLYSARDGKILKIAKDAEEAVAIATRRKTWVALRWMPQAISMRLTGWRARCRGCRAVAVTGSSFRSAGFSARPPSPSTETATSTS
ncbi:hypothetical protein ATO49_28610 [Mycolicibacterium fortuitum subsp. fortuitum DSM 46621 = ATCC 6841 = JCM 6387]|nr:hypothetical protein ATO49_28610 [Mycolicibacterium fortuitum subsp. fortuitum DSM 46621 = ATCC 6841 = JCM 6387]